MRRAGRHAALASLATLLTLAVGPGAARAQNPTIDDSWPIPSAQGDVVGMDATDGTFWVSYRDLDGPAKFDHLDNDGTNLGDGFTVPQNSWLPEAIDSYGSGRIYVSAYVSSISASGVVYSYLVESSAANHDQVFSSAGTRDRVDGAYNMELGVNGHGNIAGGTANKVSFLDFSNVSSSAPYYPQSFYGAGINSGFAPDAPWEGCSYGDTAAPGVGTPANCGTHIGVAGTGLGQLDSPVDIASTGGGGAFVLNGASQKVTLLDESFAPSLEWGSTGTASGQLASAEGMVRIPSTGHLLISDPTNRRISDFLPDGTWVRSFGWGARTGDTTKFETCDVSTGGCDSTPQNNANPRSYYTRLEIGPNGKLYAQSPLSATMEVISLSGPTPPQKRITLAANPVTVARGEKTKLTATIRPCAGAGEDRVLFEKKRGPDFELIATKPVNLSCKAALRVTITKRSKFRALAIDPEQNTDATSKVVTVDLE